MSGQKVALKKPAPIFTNRQMTDGSHCRTAIWRPEGTAKGTILLLTGRTEFIEKYDEIAHQFLERGFQVLSFDWRGQGLSDRDPEAGDRGYIKDFADYQRDLEFLIEAELHPLHQEIGENKPLHCLAHSMGGNILLNHLQDEANSSQKPSVIFDKIILSAPMTKIFTAPFPSVVAEAVANLMCLMGKGKEYAFGQGPYQADKIKFENNALTTDKKQYERMHNWLRHNPKLICSGTCWGWLSAAFDAMNALKDRKKLEKVTADILILSSKHDRVVDASNHEEIANTLPNSILKSYIGTEHELLFEQHFTRDLVWAEIDSFLQKKDRLSSNCKFTLKKHPPQGPSIN